MLDMVTGPLDRSQYEEPDAVALAALDFLTSDSPKRRYMVVPNQSEAAITIRQAISEVVQLNEGQPYTYSRDELVGMLDEALEGTLPASGGESQEAAGGAVAGLQEAAATGDLEALRGYIEAGADLNEREPGGGSSPLITAATFGQTEAARMLIDAGANLDQQNNDGTTALISAAFFCRTEIVEALLEAGADPSIRNDAGSTALDAVSGPWEDVQGIYEFVGAALQPYGLRLDYDRIRETRPQIAEMLR